VPPAVIALDFDPILRFGGLAFRLDTFVTALGILAALLVAAAVARRTPAPGEEEWLVPIPLRLDDLLFITLAALPGALIGGRVGYVLLHLDFYLANPSAVLDFGLGSLELGLAVVGGALTGGFAAHVLSGNAGRWFHMAAIPTLVAIGVGKVAMALGGSGQGTPSSADWATSYLGPGPWGSLAPEIAALPAQLFEAAAVGMIALIVLAFHGAGLFRRRDGTAWLVAVGGWALGRAAIASTWRDPVVIGPLRMEQVISLGIAVGCAGVGIWLARRRLARSGPPVAEPRWPDPETRPHF
jgi:phosphatidylglycerol:prolipoprotein diacylglycerol transferase